jgi:hypothetical protein
MSPVLAHAGHWYHSLLYLLPLIVLVALAISGAVRSSREDSSAE